MKRIELCAHNLKQADAREAALQLEARVAGRAELVTVNCIHSCKACHAGALIARLNDQVIGDLESDAVIACVMRLIEE